MRIVTGNIGAFTLAIESVTHGGHQALTSLSDDATQEIRAALVETLNAMLRHGYLPAGLPTPSDERKILVAAGDAATTKDLDAVERVTLIDA
jgi:hypothetical protein